MSANGLAAKLLEVQRTSDNQALRCKMMLAKLKMIQFQEMEQFEEQQFESIVKVLARHEGIELKDTPVPEFLSKNKPPVPPPHAFEEDELKGKEEPVPYEVGTKYAKTEIQDVSHMIKHNIKEARLSVVNLDFDLDDADTDSSSDYEDIVERDASIGGSLEEDEETSDNLVYLPTEHNPAVNWAKSRIELMSKFVWLKDYLKTIELRMNQQNQLLKYIQENKPPFKFDPDAKRPEPNLPETRPVEFLNIKTFKEADGEESKNYTVGVFTCKFDTYKIIDPKDGIARPPPRPKTPKYTTCNADAGRIGGGLEHMNLVMKGPDVPTSSRCNAIMKPIKQRKVFQIGGIHNIIGKNSKPPTTLCPCFGRTELCVRCSGRSDKVKRVRPGAMSQGESMALLDHNYHKVLSSSEERPLTLLTEAAYKVADWDKKKRGSHASAEEVEDDIEDCEEVGDGDLELRDCITFYPVSHPRLEKSTSPLPDEEDYEYDEYEQYGDYERSSHTRRDKRRSERERRMRKRKRYSDEEDDEEDSDSWSPVKSSANMNDIKRRRTENEKYDIDHIVIPYSIAAATRVEKIEYKEIVLPSWRMNPIDPEKRPEAPPCKSSPRHTRSSRKSTEIQQMPELVLVKTTEDSEDKYEVEDLSLEAVLARHARSEIEEKKRFLNSMNMFSNRRARKSETKAENNSDFSSPASPQPSESGDCVTVKEEPGMSPNPNHISAADASLAVTALKVNSAPTASQSPIRRRTISSCKYEDEEIEDEGVPPFEPRQFPLTEDTYGAMVKEMKESYLEAEREIKRERSREEFEFPDIVSVVDEMPANINESELLVL